MSQVVYKSAVGVVGPLSAGVVIDVVETVEFAKNVIVDQRGNYVATKFRLVIQGLLSRTVTAYTGAAGGVPSRAVSGVTTGAISDVAIRDYLAQPRGLLTYSVGGVNLIQTGLFGDATNGPVPLEVPTVTQVIGSPTMHIRCGWEAIVNETRRTTRPPFATNIPNTNTAITALLSLTYKQEEIIDQDGYSQILTTGRALFRGDRMRQLALTPDAFRDWMLLPVHPTCRRDRIHVAASEDGNSLEFAVLDKEVYVRIVHPSVSRIEGTHTVSIVQPSGESLVTTTASTAWSMFREIAAFARGSSDSRANNGNNGNNATFNQPRLQLVSGAGGAIYSWLTGVMPQVEHGVVVRVWGYSSTGHLTIADIANRVMASRLAAVTGRGGALNHSGFINQTRDLTGSFVEVRAVYTSSLVTGAGELFVNGLPNIPDTNRHFPSTIVDNTVAALEMNRIMSGSVGDGQPGPPQNNASDTGNRGNIVSSVAAQSIALQSTLQQPTIYLPRPTPRTP